LFCYKAKKKRKGEFKLLRRRRQRKNPEVPEEKRINEREDLNIKRSIKFGHKIHT
jgi:hypothetical protein